MRSLPGTAWVEADGYVVLAFFNVSRRRAVRTFPLRRFGANRWHVFDYWQERYLGVHAELSLTVPAHGCRLVRLTPVSADPVVVGANGHLLMAVGDFSLADDDLRVSSESQVWVSGRLRGDGWLSAGPKVWKTRSAGTWTASVSEWR